MGKNLLIVESPAKAKTIEKILGKDFTVKSSFGHVRDLAKDSKEKKAIDVENGYALNYIVSDDKRKVVKDLKDWVKKVDEVWLATDEDREGEAISWHLAKVLGLDVDKTKRIVFREITKPAITKAVQSPRTINQDVVNAQQARRVLDRLVGFELSGLLWKKIKGKLSAGRVQSVAVKLIVEKEREIQAFKPSPFFRVNAFFNVKHKNGQPTILKSDLSERLDDGKTARAFLEKCMSGEFAIKDIQVKPTKRKPAAPFTTSTLQQEASRKLGFSVSRTMSNAQRLYEAGMITYMRTDSTSLSETALTSIEKQIRSEFGDNYVHVRRYKTSKAGAQEAHEAIRPTYIERANAVQDRDQQRLYELIRKRTLASQMAEAKLEKTNVDIRVSTAPASRFMAHGEVLKFDGFLKVYMESKDDEEDNEDGKDQILPPLEVGQVLDLRDMVATERFTKPPARYTEAGLVKKLEELGIGRPSTYAPTISKIMEPSRGYITKEVRDGYEREFQVITLTSATKTITEKVSKEITNAQKNKLFASDLGMLVIDFLSQHFGDIMNYSFTAEVEGKLDEVADGAKQWVDVIDNFYKPFHKTVEKTTEEADRVTGERILGTDEKTGHTILARMSRFGPVVQMGTPEEVGEDGKSKFANLKINQSIETITIEEAKELFQFPKVIGEYEGEEVIIGEGRFGPYVKFDGKFISIPKTEDPHAIEMARAIELILEKRKADAPIGHYEDKPITKGSGRFGPFVKWGSFYCSITKGSGFQLETITEEQAIVLVKAKIEKEANRYVNIWEDEKLAVENGRWGPFIKVLGTRKNYKLPKDSNDEKYTSETAAVLTLEDVKKIIEEQGGTIPKEKKKPAAKKKTTAKKTTTKKKAPAKKKPVAKKGK